eukprot:TRINITY_DN1649_c0_g1_i1.p1 TRINITY_DN1649_c0_g1~~TRINITY_DN1649_c0_g1_i1.p1  ORF type:complete len:663 (+),score=221.97 TRINITY_DN1649_c0_g1_i1:61-2049(+)
MSKQILQKAANEARGLAMDAVAKAASGHLGLPLGCAELGAVLFGKLLRYNSAHPEWINRDIFILSAGHGSMFMYSWLHMSGYKISRDDVINFRQLHHNTMGHPEFRETDGIEATTGPLGQGVGNAVGYAVALKMAASRFNTSSHQIFSKEQKVVCLAGDGCLQEGVASEASAFAGHFGLDNLILFYDSNDVTLDAMADATQSEDTEERYKAYRWDVQVVKDGQDMDSIEKAYEIAKSSSSGRPQMIILKTTIAKGISEVAGTNKGHGEAGVKFVDESRKKLGLPEEKFYVSKETKEYFAEHKTKLSSAYSQWESIFNEWKQANPDLYKLLESPKEKVDPIALLSKVPVFADAAIATRKAGQDVLQPLAQSLPLFISGSADLHGSTLNYIANAGDFTRSNASGRNIKFGIREHAMGAMLNGFAYHGIFKPSGATFLVFSDYCRPSIRIAALSHLPVTYIFTHDSVAVGEDGPTHQPVETLNGLRMIPGLDVIRPCDPEETAGAFASALSRSNGPTLLALSRQALPYLGSDGAQARRVGVLHGAYIIHKETEELKVIIIATGSEVSVAIAAAKKLGNNVRVVSMPCSSIFDQQTTEYKETVLPTTCRKRVSVEAGVTSFWYKYVGLDGKTVGIDRFGLSGPGSKVLTELGISADHVVSVVQSLL